jgi:hypothetical protein
VKTGLKPADSAIFEYVATQTQARVAARRKVLHTAKKVSSMCEESGEESSDGREKALLLGFRPLSNFSRASPRFLPSWFGRRRDGLDSLANLPCSGLSFESIRCREVRQPSADQPQPVISNDQTPFFLAKYKMNQFFLLDDRLAKFTSPTICINMSIGSRTTL